MSSIHVCSLQAAPALAADIGATGLISILHREQTIDTPDSIPKDRHLRLIFDDALQFDPKYLMPSADHVHAMIRFAEGWDRIGPLLIHCTQGVIPSRTDQNP